MNRLSNSRSSTRSRLADRADQAGLSIPAGLAAQLVTYYDLLQHWNRTINLTGLGDTDAAIDRLLLEPVAAAKHLLPGPAMLDIGSGGGSPAIPLALSVAATSLAMVESHTRKAAFLREIIRELNLRDAIVYATRFEALPESVGARDLITARAIKLERRHLQLLSTLVRPSGTLALFFAPGEQISLAGTGLWESAVYPLPTFPHSTLRLIQRRDSAA